MNATFFGVYGNTIKWMQKTSGRPSDAVPSYQTVALAGMVAGTVQLLVNCPVELVKIKLQVATIQGMSFALTITENSHPYKASFAGGDKSVLLQTNSAMKRTVQRPYRGPIDCLIALYKVQGIRGWYKGLVAMFWR